MASSARMTWSFHTRLLTDILFDSDTGLNPAQRVAAFNAIFKDEIQGFGFVNGFPYPRIKAQYGERMKTNKDWIRIRSSAPTPADADKRREMRARLDDFLRTQSSGPSRATATKKRTSDFDDDEQGASVPLSKRPAIGLWTPVTPRSVRARRVPPSKSTTPRESESAAVNKPVSPKSARVRPDGSTIMIADDIVIRELVPSISQYRAQPPLPQLLSRLWRDDPSQRDSHKGFWSRRHHKKNALSSTPPRSSSIDATDILDHMNRTLVDTPFISTSNRLIWMVQQMVTAIKAHSSQWYVSVIDVDALDKRGVFWARPFHDEVRLSKPFTNGAGNYRGSYEFLVWQKIPETAILHTFMAQDLLDLALTNHLSKTLRFEVLTRSGALATKIAILREQRVPLSYNTIDVMATLVQFFGLRSPYRPGHISAIVAGICEGWGLHVFPRDEQEWQSLANHFATQLHAYEPRERQDVKFAFLDGVAWGCGDPNARHTAAGIEKKVKRARYAGLRSPGDILAHELDALKLTLIMREKGEQRSLQKYHAIEAASHTDDDEMYDRDELETDHNPESTGDPSDEEIMFDWEDDVMME